MRILGRLDGHSICLAEARGIDLLSGSLRPDGRVILVARQFPATHSRGCALRSRVVWWLHTGDSWRGDKWNVHHKNGDRSDDRISNLEKLTQSSHSTMHATKEGSHVGRLCLLCAGYFEIERWRLKDASRGKYCSQSCYQSAPKSEESNYKRGDGLRKAYAEGRR
jgi:hypothetical protein